MQILLEKSTKEPKPEVKIEMPVKTPGFMPLDIIKGNKDNKLVKNLKLYFHFSRTKFA